MKLDPVAQRCFAKGLCISDAHLLHLLQFHEYLLRVARLHDAYYLLQTDIQQIVHSLWRIIKARNMETGDLWSVLPEIPTADLENFWLGKHTFSTTQQRALYDHYHSYTEALNCLGQRYAMAQAYCQQEFDFIRERIYGDKSWE